MSERNTPPSRMIPLNSEHRNCIQWLVTVRSAMNTSSSFPSLGFLVISNELEIDIERLEHHVHSEGLHPLALCGKAVQERVSHRRLRHP